MLHLSVPHWFSSYCKCACKGCWSLLTTDTALPPSDWNRLREKVYNYLFFPFWSFCTGARSLVTEMPYAKNPTTVPRVMLTPALPVILPCLWASAVMWSWDHCKGTGSEWEAHEWLCSASKDNGFRKITLGTDVKPNPPASALVSYKGKWTRKTQLFITSSPSPFQTPDTGRSCFLLILSLQKTREGHCREKAERGANVTTIGCKEWVLLDKLSPCTRCLGSDQCHLLSSPVRVSQTARLSCEDL